MVYGSNRAAIAKTVNLTRLVLSQKAAAFWQLFGQNNVEEMGKKKEAKEKIITLPCFHICTVCPMIPPAASTALPPVRYCIQISSSFIFSSFLTCAYKAWIARYDVGNPEAEYCRS